MARTKLSRAAAADGPEIFGFQTGATDEPAIDVFDGEYFLGIPGIYRAAIEQMNRFRIGGVTGQQGPDMIMNFRDLLKCRRSPCSDGPDRFIGNNGIRGSGALWQRPRDLIRDNRQRFPAIALFERFTDADDGNQPLAVRRRLRPRHRRPLRLRRPG